MNRFTLALICCLPFLPSLAAQTAEGLRAPANRWYVTGGSASRSRVAATRIVPDKLEPTWTLDADGRFWGETLVWDDKALVLERGKDGDYRLLQVELADGRVSARSARVACAGPADLAIWGRRALVSLPGVGFTGYGLTRSIVAQKWRIADKADFASPVLLKDDVYLRMSGNIVHYRWGKREPTWTCAGSYVGRFAVVGDEIFALSFSGGMAALDVIDRVTGKVTSSLKLGMVNTQFKTFEPLVQVGPDFVLVTLPGLLVGDQGAGGNAALLAREMKAGRSQCRALGDVMVFEPAVMRAENVCFRGESIDSGESWFITTEKGFAVLATKKERADIFAPALFPIQAGGRVWLGDLAFEPRNGRIARASSIAGSRQAVPAQGMILLRSADDGKIIALREKVAATARSTEAIQVAAGRAVLANGEVLSGRIEISPEANTLACFDPKDRRSDSPLAEVLVVEDATGLMHFRASDEDVVRGVQILDDEDRGEIAFEAANAARRAKSMERLESYLDEATEYGVDEKRLASLQKALDGFAKKPSKADAKKVAELEAERNAAVASMQGRDWKRIEGLGDEEHELRIELLRRLLQRVPDHAPAAALVRSWLPPEINPGADFRPAEWLDLVLATRRCPIRVVIPPEAGKESEADAMQREVGAARHTWRKDVIGISSAQLLVITPLENPSQLANCLTVGEMVGSELERMFGGARDSRYPLRIHLFPTKKDYIDFHNKRGQPSMQFSLGNYSPRENISRLFVPDDADEFNEMLSTFVHEMTHHWVNVRCPLVTSAAAAKSLRRSRGFFIVEGLATMMEEFVYDARTGKVETDGKAVDSLDTVANCPEQALLPWNILVLASHLQFGRMMENPQPIPGLLVPMTWQLGLKRQPSVVNLFYAQAGALCHYLYHAEEGKYRQALIDFVGRYYGDEAVDWVPDKDFGADPEALGQKVRAWAKARVSP